MGIKSNAFGRVTLTEKDAQKFVNQVRYGRPKKAAVESVKAGAKMADEFGANGYLIIQTQNSAAEEQRAR